MLFYKNLLMTSELTESQVTGTFTVKLEFLRTQFYTNMGCIYVEAGNCEVCGKHPINYQFFIINIKTGKSLKVGSECITKFPVKVLMGDGSYKMISTFQFGESIKSSVQRMTKRVARLNELIKMGNLVNIQIPPMDVNSPLFEQNIGIQETRINDYFKANYCFEKREIIDSPILVEKTPTYMKFCKGSRLFVLFFPKSNYPELYESAKKFNAVNIKFTVTNESKYNGMINYVIVPITTTEDNF